VPVTTQRPVLDDAAKRIIEQLQEDGRRPYGTIGKAVGLSEAAVRQRVQRLVDGGVMQIVAVTDPVQVGFARQAMIGIRCEGDVEAVAEKIADMIAPKIGIDKAKAAAIASTVLPYIVKFLQSRGATGGEQGGGDQQGGGGGGLGDVLGGAMKKLF